MAGIKFLTETGHMCTDWRQEFILLSDTLGVSMLVETINNRKPSGATETTVLGPFYISDAPRYPQRRQHLPRRQGRADAGARPRHRHRWQADQGALLDVWQANDEGFYDVQQKGIQPDMNLRGIFRPTPTAATGSARPSRNTTRSRTTARSARCCGARPPPVPPGAHPLHRRRRGLHADHHACLRPGDPYLATDAVFGVKESLIVEFRKIDDPAEIAGSRLRRTVSGRPSATSCWPRREVKKREGGFPALPHCGSGNQAATAATRRCRSCAKMMPWVIR